MGYIHNRPAFQEYSLLSSAVVTDSPGRIAGTPKDAQVSYMRTS